MSYAVLFALRIGPFFFHKIFDYITRYVPEAKTKAKSSQEEIMDIMWMITCIEINPKHSYLKAGFELKSLFLENATFVSFAHGKKLRCKFKITYIFIQSVKLCKKFDIRPEFSFVQYPGYQYQILTRSLHTYFKCTGNK